jgi:transcription initiation factor TFIIIB Brf1 subunit/transcription initiation factor TFIIB
LSETEQCLECGGNNILHDEISGETVCRDCGLVLGKVEFTPPPDRVPKNAPTNPIAYTSIALGTKIQSTQRLELNVVHDIKRIVDKLDLPKITERLAVICVCRIRRNRAQQNTQNIRLTRTELTAASVWTAIKQLKHPMSYKEYTQKINPIIGKVNLIKIQKRISQFIENTPHITDITLIKAHINKMVATLENNSVVDTYYANLLGRYAIEMVHTKPTLLKGRRSDLIAASAIYAADGLMAEYFALQVFAEFANVGTANLSTIAQTLKRYAPKAPKESAAIFFTENLFRGVF